MWCASNRSGIDLAKRSVAHGLFHGIALSVCVECSSTGPNDWDCVGMTWDVAEVGHQILGETFQMNSVLCDIQVLVFLLGSRSHARWVHFSEKYGWIIVPLLSTGQALRELRTRKADLAVIELSDPIDRSLRLQQLLRVRRPNIPIVVVPVRHTRQVELSVREIGAAGYISEGSGSDGLGELVTAVLERVSVQWPVTRQRMPADQGGLVGMDEPLFRGRLSYGQ